MVVRQLGLSLIELMIAVTIIGILALVAMPYTQSWLYETQLSEAKAKLNRAYAEAKALALRNPIDAHEEHTPSSCISLKNNTLQVRQPNGSSCSGILSWQDSWPDGVKVVNDNKNLTAIFINNRGAVLINNTPINTNLKYALSKGTVNDIGQL